MNKTIVALYDDIVIAQQVIEDLVNAHFARNSISLITNDAQNQYSHYLDRNYTPRHDAITAGEGASFGAVVGALTGILVGLGALTIPGIGSAIAAGPIAAGLTGILVGAVTGGIVGALVKSGIPEDEAPYYAEAIRRGATLVSIETFDTIRAQDIINRYGAINLHERINLWRQEGWPGLNAESAENQDTGKPPTEKLARIPMETTPADTDLVRAELIYPMIDEGSQIEIEDTPIGITPIPNETTTDPVLAEVEKESRSIGS